MVPRAPATAAALALLATATRAFAQGKIAYTPPDARQLTSVLDVGRWVSAQLGGLAHAHVGARHLPPEATPLFGEVS